MFMLLCMVGFHQYTAGMISDSGIMTELNTANTDFLGTIYNTTIKFFIFILLCVYVEIKAIFLKVFICGSNLLSF
ncbi:hypothetical protein Dip510_000483 [Elusimicrobium posterum]